MHFERNQQVSRTPAHIVIANPTPFPTPPQMSAANAPQLTAPESKIAKYLREDHGKAVITALLDAGMAKSAIFSMLDDNAVFGDGFYALMTKLKLNPTTKWHNAIKAFEAWEEWVLTQEDYWVDLVDDSEDEDEDEDDECEDDAEESQIMDIIKSAAPAPPAAPPASAVKASANKRKADEEQEEEIEAAVPHPKKAKLLEEVKDLSVTELTAMLEAAKEKQSEKERQDKLQEDLAAAAEDEEHGEDEEDDEPFPKGGKGLGRGGLKPKEDEECDFCDGKANTSSCVCPEPPKPKITKEQWVFLLKWQKSGLFNMLDHALVVKLKTKFMLTEAQAEKIHLEYCEDYNDLADYFGCALKDM